MSMVNRQRQAPLPRRAARFRRRLRRPQHSFAVDCRPFLLRPFLVAPVLPGETMKNALMQIRAVTDPINAPLMGWWMETYLAYVPLTAMADGETFKAKLLDPEADWSSLRRSTDQAATFAQDAYIDYAGRAYDAVVARFFRNENEPLGTDVNGLYFTRCKAPGWMDSMVLDEAYDEPDVDLSALSAAEVDATGGANEPVTVTDPLMASELEAAMRQYRMARNEGLTDLSWEDWLRTYGVRTRDPTRSEPEMLRYIQSWQYPTNHVDPESGVPSSAVSWSVRERADKRRLFREPGVIIGCVNFRPKVYLTGQRGQAAHLMEGLRYWFPPELARDLYASYKNVNDSEFLNASNVYVDVADLLLHGDQWYATSSAMDTAGYWNKFALPAGDDQRFYPSTTMIDSLFVSTMDPERKFVHVDGVVTFNIAGREVEQSAPTFPGQNDPD